MASNNDMNNKEITVCKSPSTKCEKNPAHEDFYPVKTFCLCCLPPENQTLEMKKEIVTRSFLTVLVTVSFTSIDRPKDYPFEECKGSDRVRRYGTGSIAEVFYFQPVIGEHCPCHVCKKTKEYKKLFWWVCVRTATHVIYDSSEERCAQFDCFYDSSDKTGVKTIYGVDVFNITTRPKESYENDACYVWCVTHDHETVKALNKINPSIKFIHGVSKSYECDPSKVIVSHPHGEAKRITVGKVLYLTVPFDSEQNADNTDRKLKPEKCIRFSSDAKYRKVKELTEAVSEKQTLTCNDKKTLENIYDEMFKQLWNDEEHSSGFTDELKPFDVSDSKASSSTDESRLPMIDFYLAYIRHCCLMHLFVKGVKHKRKKGLSSNPPRETVQDIFRLFFDQKYKPCPWLNDEKETIESVREHWMNLLFESGNQIIEKEKEHSDKPESLFNDIFEEIMTEVLVDFRKEEDSHKRQQKVIELFGEVNKFCLGLFLGEKVVEQILDEEKEEKREVKRKYEEHISLGDGSKIIPKDSTFTLPPKAKYEYRIYAERPEWICFPSKTKINFPDEKPITAKGYEFKDPNIVPERGYLTYDIKTCSGCSGAAVKFNTTGHFGRTFFPHAAWVEKKKFSKSGVQRESGLLVYPQLEVDLDPPSVSDRF